MSSAPPPTAAETAELEALRTMRASLQSLKYFSDGLLKDLEVARANWRGLDEVSRAYSDIRSTTSASAGAEATRSGNSTSAGTGRTNPS